METSWVHPRLALGVSMAFAACIIASKLRVILRTIFKAFITWSLCPNIRSRFVPVFPPQRLLSVQRSERVQISPVINLIDHSDPLSISAAAQVRPCVSSGPVPNEHWRAQLTSSLSAMLLWFSRLNTQLHYQLSARQEACSADDTFIQMFIYYPCWMRNFLKDLPHCMRCSK